MDTHNLNFSRYTMPPDPARGTDVHNGLGLWFAAQVVKAHAGQLELQNRRRFYPLLTNTEPF
ncbi:ATP-binding protein [Acetobacterium woodii]|nr:hypothetical protein [Acetobacterium woodii]